MKNQVEDIYSEVYSLLKIFGQTYIDKLPQEIYNIVRDNRNKEYTPEFSQSIEINKQSIKKETRAFIAFFKLYYWSESKEEQNKLVKLFSENEEKYQKRLMEESNPDNILAKLRSEREKRVLKEKKAFVDLPAPIKNYNIFNKLVCAIKNIFGKVKRKLSK